MVLLVAGANDDLQFGPVMTDCVTRYVLFQGPASPSTRRAGRRRVDGLVPKVEQTVGDLRTVMRDAGYADADYKLVVMGYPSPIGPDFRDNPHFPGKLLCGGMGYDSDTVWGRNTAVPAFERGMRRVAQSTGAVYLDNSRLFHGHEVCMEDTWARGLYIDLVQPLPAGLQFGPPVLPPRCRGHAAFASCLTQLYNSGLREATCADLASTGKPPLYAGAWDDAYRPLKNEATGRAWTSPGAVSRNGTAVLGWDCHGGRNQGWWYDAARGSLHTELTQDRCLDVPGGRYAAGAALVVWNCSGATNQHFVRASGTIRPTSAEGLCATLGSAQGFFAPPALQWLGRTALRVSFPGASPPDPRV